MGMFTMVTIRAVARDPAGLVLVGSLFRKWRVTKDPRCSNRAVMQHGTITEHAVNTDFSQNCLRHYRNSMVISLDNK